MNLYRAKKSTPSKPNWLGDAPVHAFDTETADGTVFLATRCLEGREPDHIGDPVTFPSLDEILTFLTHRETRGAVNVWYNLDFDAQVILSGLPETILWRLCILNKASWKGIDFLYIPRKLLRIKAGKQVYSHYDISQFFFTSLDKAAREWLGTSKLGGLDLTQFHSTEYRQENWDRILEYALKDASLTQRLARKFFTEAESLNVPCGAPMSTGYLGEQRLNVQFQATNKPGFSFDEMQSYAKESYYGGRFEVFSRGDVGDCVSLDINSAYPHILSNLPDPATLDWRKAINPTLEEILEADYGLLDISITTRQGNIQPFAIRKDARLSFPRLEGVRYYTTLAELQAALSCQLLDSVRINRAWVGNTCKETVYPFRFILELYEQRNEFKREGRDAAQKVLKIIINSIYGKLCQVTESWDVRTNVKSPEYAPLEAMPESFREWLYGGGRELVKRQKPGNYYNPFLASHITGQTRASLYTSCYETGTLGGVEMFATDSVLVSTEVYNNRTKDFDVGSDLGQWGVEGSGPAFLVGSGMYEHSTETGLKTRTRGFERGRGSWAVNLEREGGLRAVAQRYADSDAIPITTTRPLKIGQALWQNHSLADIGSFQEFPKSLRAGFDQKRDWTRGAGITFGDLLEGREPSTPLLESLA